GGSGSLDALPAGYRQMATGPYNALFVLDGGALRYVSNNHLLNTWRTAYGSNGPAGSGFAQVALNAATAVGVKTDGTLWQWKGEEQPASLGAGYGQVAKGTSHTVALKTDGTVWVWGSNANGQLGVDSPADVDSPQLLGNGYTEIAAAALHTLALKSDGTLMAWGSNSVGQLGTGPAGAAPVQPTPVVFEGPSPGQLGEMTVTGPIELQTLTVRVQISSEHLASGVEGDVYLMVFGPDSSGFSYNGYGFAPLTPFGIPLPWIHGLENRTTVLISNQDLRALRGSTLYVGYGLKSDKQSSTLYEMVASKRYQLVHTIR
ncbi:Regulator of chromosome condensation (RCC1) repeat containing protein, partial [Acidovorax sp. CF316]